MSTTTTTNQPLGPWTLYLHETRSSGLELYNTSSSTATTPAYTFTLTTTAAQGTLLRHHQRSYYSSPTTATIDPPTTVATIKTDDTGRSGFVTAGQGTIDDAPSQPFTVTSGKTEARFSVPVPVPVPTFPVSASAPGGGGGGGGGRRLGTRDLAWRKVERSERVVGCLPCLSGSRTWWVWGLVDVVTGREVGEFSLGGGGGARHARGTIKFFGGGGGGTPGDVGVDEEGRWVALAVLLALVEGGRRERRARARRRGRAGDAAAAAGGFGAVGWTMGFDTGAGGMFGGDGGGGGGGGVFGGGGGGDGGGGGGGGGGC